MTEATHRFGEAQAHVNISGARWTEHHLLKGEAALGEYIADHAAEGLHDAVDVLVDEGEVAAELLDQRTLHRVPQCALKAGQRLCADESAGQLKVHADRLHPLAARHR